MQEALGQLGLTKLCLFLSGHPGQASLWGDVDTSVVGRPRCDALWPHAAAHRCALASPAPGGEEGGVMAAGGGMAQWHPSLLPHDSGPGPQPALNAPAMDLLSPVRLLNLQSHADCVCPSRPAVVWWQ